MKIQENAAKKQFIYMPSVVKYYDWKKGDFLKYKVNNFENEIKQKKLELVISWDYVAGTPNFCPFHNQEKVVATAWNKSLSSYLCEECNAKVLKMSAARWAGEMLFSDRLKDLVGWKKE